MINHIPGTRLTRDSQTLEKVMAQPPEEDKDPATAETYIRTAAQARDVTRTFLASVGPSNDAEAEAVLLVVSELVTNAERHAAWRHRVPAQRRARQRHGHRLRCQHRSATPSAHQRLRARRVRLVPRPGASRRRHHRGSPLRQIRPGRPASGPLTSGGRQGKGAAVVTGGGVGLNTGAETASAWWARWSRALTLKPVTRTATGAVGFAPPSVST